MSFFRFRKDEARKAIDFWLFLTFKMRGIDRPPLVFLLSLFAAMVSPDNCFSMMSLGALRRAVLTTYSAAVREEPSSL